MKQLGNKKAGEEIYPFVESDFFNIFLSLMSLSRICSVLG